jgi:hypothetical protein
VHVLTYTLTTAAAVGAVWWGFDLPITWWGFAVGQVVSGVTHYWADRRFTLQRLCDRLGKSGFYQLGQPRHLAAWDSNDTVVVDLYEAGKDDPVEWDNSTLGTGAYALDQSWHCAWLGAAAVLTAVL